MTSTNDTELCKRLRDGDHILHWSGGAVPEPERDEFVLANPDGPEAADRIESLTARIGELESEKAKSILLIDRMDQCLVAAQHGDPNDQAILKVQRQARSLCNG